MKKPKSSISIDLSSIKIDKDADDKAPAATAQRLTTIPVPKLLTAARRSLPDVATNSPRQSADFAQQQLAKEIARVEEELRTAQEEHEREMRQAEIARVEAELRKAEAKKLRRAKAEEEIEYI